MRVPDVHLSRFTTIGRSNSDPFYINSEFEKTFSQKNWWSLIIAINEFSCLEQVNSENFNGDREGIFLI